MSAPTSAARAAQDSTAFRVIARTGYAVLGILHLLIGGIAVSVAVGAGGGEADQGGAMQQIRSAPAGVFVLWLVAIGLAALAIWQIAEAILERDEDAKKKWGRRAKFVGTAVAYFAIAGTAVVYALGGQSNSGSSAESLSAQLMANPAGVFVVGVVGVAIAGVGIGFIVSGATRSFEKNLALPGGGVRKGVVALGVVGYIAKGISIGVIGVLFVVAAFTHDPQTAGGLDQALKTLTSLPFGAVILWVVGVGLAIYGLYCFARARYAKL